MEAKGETDWGAIQWLITTFLGIIAFFYGIITKNLYTELKDIKESQDKMIKEASENINKGDDVIWEELKHIQQKLDQSVGRDEFIRLQNALEDDRRLAANDRANIAVMMATKNELDRQLNRLYDRLVATWKENKE